MLQKNFKIKWFLISSFSIVLIMMVLLGASSVYFSRQLADQMIVFYESPHTVQLHVAEVRRDMSEIGSNLKSAMVSRTNDRLAEVEEDINVLIEDMTMRIGVVKKQFTGDQALLTDADAIVEDWLAMGVQLKDMMVNGAYDEAVAMFRSDYIPLEEKMANAVQKISDYAGTDSLAYYQQAQRSRQISLIVIVGSILVAIAITAVTCSSVVKSIAIPLKEVKQAAEELAKGNLHHEITFHGKNEFGQLADSMRGTTATLAAYVENIDQVLDQMAHNDLTVTVDREYIGDFASIKTSLERIVDAFSDVMLHINNSSEQVSGGAEQVASTAQMLSQGASEQAASLEELSASIGEITAQVEQNSAYTDETNDLVMEVGNELEHGNQQMQQMLVAISEINEASDQIAKIIKTIEDIAFQTNILALNAAVEAARAGAAGKGFAVVADEVRSLAGKSAEAAKSTTDLIQNSIRAVQNGTQIADRTAKALSTVVKGAENITGMVGKIAQATEGQALSIQQINQAVVQISQVVQTNSATAEESAAASQEMSGQAQLLGSLVKQFRFRARTNASQFSQPQDGCGFQNLGGSKY